jgi:hypothetical protein
MSHLSAIFGFVQFRSGVKSKLRPDATRRLGHQAFYQRKNEIFVSSSAYKFQEEARFIPPWIALLKVCPAVAKEAALLTEAQTRIYEENIK